MPLSSSAAAFCRLPRSYNDTAAAPRLDSDRHPPWVDRRSPAYRSAPPIWHPTSAAWQGHCDACLVACEDLWAAEVAAIGDGLERLDLQNGLRLLGDIGMLCPI